MTDHGHIGAAGELYTRLPYTPFGQFLVISSVWPISPAEWFFGKRFCFCSVVSVCKGVDVVLAFRRLAETNLCNSGAIMTDQDQASTASVKHPYDLPDCVCRKPASEQNLLGVSPQRVVRNGKGQETTDPTHKARTLAAFKL